MLRATLLITLLAAWGAAAPLAHPAIYFETDPMLQVGEKEVSSYADGKSKRAIFETDPMLQVGEKQASSYAEN